MVLIRCHTISKSIASYDQLDDIIDGVNDYPLTTDFNVRHERCHPKFRKEETGKATDLVATPENTNKRKEKASTTVTTQSTKRKDTTKAYSASTAETTKPSVATPYVNTKPVISTEKPTLNLFRRLKHKFGWKNKTPAKSTTKKRKFMFHKKHKETTAKDKTDRDKRRATSTTTLDFMDHDAKQFGFFRTKPEKIAADYTSYDNLSNITSNNILEGLDNAINKYISAMEISANDSYSSESTSPSTTVTSADKFPQELLEDMDTFKGTASIEQLLNKIKMHAINIISQQEKSVSEVITNSVTETTFDVDPLLHVLAQTTFGAFDFKDDEAELAESATENKKAPIATTTKETTQAKLNDASKGYNLEYKLQREMKYALMRAKDTLTGKLNKARDQVKSVTWKIMHSTAGGLNDVANKIEHAAPTMEIPSTKETLTTTVSEQPAKLVTLSSQVTTPTAQIKKPLKTKPPKQRPKLRPSSPATSGKILTTTINKNPQTIRQNRGTSTNAIITEDNYPQEQDDYTMLKVYEKNLATNDKNIRMLNIQKPSLPINYFKGKLSKRDTETIEDLNLKEHIRKLVDGEGMPDIDYININYQKQNTTQQTNAPHVEVYDDGATSRMTDATLRELTSPDNSFVGLTNKIHYNEFINGYKHYLNFTKDMSNFDHNYSNLVRYQAHRHHNVDDIGKFILTRLPPIPEWKSQPPLYKTGKRFLYDELEVDNQKKTQNEGSWFSRHFRSFRDTDPKKKFHTEQTVTLKSEMRKPVTENIKKNQTEPNVKDSAFNEERVPGEKEGLIFRWKPNDPFHTKQTQSTQAKLDPIVTHWDTSTGEMQGEKPTHAAPSEIDLKDLLAKISKSSSADLLLDIHINELIKKVSSDTALKAMSEILKSTLPMQSSTLAEGVMLTEGFDLNKILAFMPTTSAQPKPLSYNGLVSAFILRNYTTESSIRKSILDDPRNFINKLLNRPGRMNAEKHDKGAAHSGEVADVENAELKELSRSKRHRKNSYYVPKEELEHMRKSTVPTNLFEDSPVYPAKQGVKYDKLAYVDLNLVTKPTNTVPKKTKKTKKSKYKKVLDKFTFKKKGSQVKDKILAERTRKERHSPFKILKNLFKPAQTDPEYNGIYETTKPYTFKLTTYADMERTLKDDMLKQVPNITDAEMTFQPFGFDKVQSLSPINFPKTITDSTMNPVLADTTSGSPVTFSDLISYGFTDFRQDIKKKLCKTPLSIKNDPNMPFRLKVTPSLEHSTGSPSPTLHVTLTPVTLDELMRELRVNNKKFKMDNIIPTPRTYITKDLALDKPVITRMTPKPIARAQKIKFKQYFDGFPVRYTNRIFKNANNTTTKYYKHETNDKEHQIIGINNKLQSTKNFVYDKEENKEFDKEDNRNENDLFGSPELKHEKGARTDDVKFQELEENVLYKDEKLGNSIHYNDFNNFKRVKNYNKDGNKFDASTFINFMHERKDSDNYYGYKKSGYDENYKGGINSKSMKNFNDNLNTNNFGNGKDVTRKFIRFKSTQHYTDEETDSFPFSGTKNNAYDYDGFTDGINDNRDATEFHGINFDYNNYETTESFSSHVMENDDRDAFKVHYSKNARRDEIKSSKSLYQNDDKIAAIEFILSHSYKTPRQNNMKKTIAEPYIQEEDKLTSKYDTKHFDINDHETLKNIDTKLHNSVLVFHDNNIATKISDLKTRTESTKPYKRTKAYKSYPDYFNDFLNWNQDILSSDSVTVPTVDQMMSTLYNYTTVVGMHRLREEILHMQNYLKGLTNTTTKKTMTRLPVKLILNTNQPPSLTNSLSLTRTTTQNVNKLAKKREHNKVVNRRRNRHEKAKPQSLEQLNEMFNINKVHRESFNKYSFPENSRGRVLTTFVPIDERTQSPIMDSSVLAYDDTLNILSDEFKVDSYTSPKYVRSKPEHKMHVSEHKGFLSSKTKVNSPPEQYFRTPVPMKSSDFDHFLKENNLDIANITKPYTEVSDLEEKWDRGLHVQSKLMDARGKHEKFVDVPKMLKELTDVNYTPKRIQIATSQNNFGKFGNTESTTYQKNKHKMPTNLGTIKDPRSHNEYVYLDDSEYIGFEDIKTKPQSVYDNTYNNNEISLKRNIRPLNIKKTTALASFDRTDKANTPNLDITIIDIDDIMSISKSGNSGNVIKAAKKPSPETTTIPHVSAILTTPKPGVIEYNSLDIDPEVSDVPDTNEMQSLPDQNPGYNVTEERNEHNADNVLNSEDIENTYKHREDDFNFHETLFTPLQKESNTYSKLNSLITTDMIGSKLFHTNLNRKMKTHKNKKKYDTKSIDKPLTLHNDLLYHSLDIENFVGTTLDQTLLPAKPVLYHQEEHKPLERSTTISKYENQDTADKMESLKSEHEFKPSLRSKVYNLNVRPVTTAYGKAKQHTPYIGYDLFSPRRTTRKKSTPAISLQQKFMKQPKRILFSSHTQKYDVMYDDDFKSGKSHHKGSHMLKTTIPSDQFYKLHRASTLNVHLTKTPRSTSWYNGEIEVNKIVRDVLGSVNKEGRRRRKAMWRKWKISPNSTATNDTKEPIVDPIPTRRWFKFMPKMQKSTQRSTPTTSTSTILILPSTNLKMQKSTQRTTPTTSTSTTILILPSTNLTSSPISLTSTVPQYHEDINKREQRSSDSLVYIVDVLNEENPVRMSPVADSERSFPKPGDVTFIYPAHLVNVDGKYKLNTSEKIYIEQDWATTLKPHIPRFKTYHPSPSKPCQTCQPGQPCQECQKLALEQKEENCDCKEETSPEPCPLQFSNLFQPTLMANENPEENTPDPMQSHSNNNDWINLFRDDEVRDTQLNPQNKEMYNFPASIVTSPQLYDTPEMKYYFRTFNLRAQAEPVERSTAPAADVSGPGIFTSILLVANTKDENQGFDTDALMTSPNAQYNKAYVKMATTCCLGSLPTPHTLKTTPPTTNNNIAKLTKLKQDIAMLEKGIEARKLNEEQPHSKSKIQIDLEAVLDSIEAAESTSSPESSTKTESSTETESTPGTESTTTTTERVAALENPNDVSKEIAEQNKTVKENEAAVAKAATNAQKEQNKITKENEAAVEQAAADAQKAAQKQIAAEAKAAAEAQAAVEAKKTTEAKIAADANLAAAKAKADAEQCAKHKAEYKKGSTKVTTKTTRVSNSPFTHRGKSNTKLTSKQTVSMGGSSVKKPAKLSASNVTKLTTLTTTASTQKITAAQNFKKAKNSKSKRQTNEPFNSVYTAKDVAALEVIVDLMKEPSESASVKPSKHYENIHHPSTNAIQVHIALPYQMENRKRAVEPTKLRKVFAAKMSVPVDIEYQVRSLDVAGKIPSPTKSQNYISTGMYLLVEDAKNNNGFALKPMIRQINKDFVTSTVKTNSPENLARVTLSKDYIQSINKPLIQLYQNLSSLEQPTTHSIQKRFDKNRVRQKKKINWEQVKKIFISNKRVCNCKCSANHTMCRACAVSDAVMTELLFEFENLAQYMNDHCTEIQTYFWMNPSGGRRLRDIVHQIDKNINDYYKRVKGKCHGRPCNAFDKREITIPYTENEDEYIGLPLINDVENLDKSLREAQKLRLICNKQFKDIVDKLVKTSMECTKGLQVKRSVHEPRKVYTLDNINVNIICNKDASSSFQTDASSSPSSVYDFMTTEFPVIDYTDDEIKKKSGKSLKKIFKRKNTRSHKKSIKRETNLQTESPLFTADRQALWREYLKQAESSTESYVKPVVTLDVLEKIDENTVTLNPHLKATLVEILPGNYSNDTKNNALLQMSEVYPQRVSSDNDYFTIDDLTTKPQPIMNDMNELSNLFEAKDINGYLKSRFAKSTSDVMMTKDKIEIKSSVKTVTTTNATTPIEIRPMIVNVTTIASSQISSRSTDAWVDDRTFKSNKNAEAAPPKTEKTTTKESWFHRLKNIITPNYPPTTEKPKVNSKESMARPQQELFNKLNVVMNANLDVNSDVTTTSFPTLFIIEDVANYETINPESYENLLIKIMEYEKDKIDDELSKHKKRQEKILNNDSEINDGLGLDSDKDLRVTKLVLNSKRLAQNVTDSAVGDYCIYKSWKNCKTATTSQKPAPSDPKLKEGKTLIQMLLQSVKRNSAKAGKRPINKFLQENNQRETAQFMQYIAPTQPKPVLNEPAGSRQESPKIWREPMEGQEPQRAQPDSTATQPEPINRQQESKERQSQSQSITKTSQQHAQKPQQPENEMHHLNNDNVDIFLAQFASTIIFSQPNYRQLFSKDKGSERLKIYQEDSTPYNDLFEVSNANSSASYITPTSSSFPSTSSPKTMGYVRSTIHAPQTKNIPVIFSFNVDFKKGKITNQFKNINPTSKQRIKPLEKKSSAWNSTIRTPSVDSTTPLNATTKEKTPQEIITETMPQPATTERHDNADVTEDNQEIYDEEKALESNKPTEMKKMEETNTVPSTNKNADKLTTKIYKHEFIPKPDDKKQADMKAEPKNCTNNKGEPGREKTESSFKKILNKDWNKQTYHKEACDPKTEACLCDIHATSEHIVDVRKRSPRKDFEQYVKNITCYKYRRPPPLFLLETWKRKVLSRKNLKQKRINKYFDSVPMKKSLKWDWIRRKRSLSSIVDDNFDDDDDFDEVDGSNYLFGDSLFHETNINQKEHPIANEIKNGFKGLNEDYANSRDEDFESLYKGEDGIYRTIRKRLKRTAGDMKELVHGLKNLPLLKPMENELYAMQGDKISLDCLHGTRYYTKTDSPVFWDTDRSDMLTPPNVIVNGPAVIFKKVLAKNSGNYTCSQCGKTRTVQLTVVTLPQYHVVFIPIYSSEHGCSYEDLKVMQRLGPLMARESCDAPENTNSIQIDEPICLEDKDDGTVHIRATAILTACPHPDVKCSAQCRRDLQCAFALLCAANAPVLHNVKVVVAWQGYNKTLMPSYGNNRRLIVTHTLRKKDLQKNTEYHQLAASMYPGNLDIVISCPAGFYLIPKQKICAACPADTYAAAGENTCYSCAAGSTSQPGAARCRLSLRRMRRYDQWWWYPPCGYVVAGVCALCACAVCAACALLAHVTSRSTARAHAAAVSVARVDSRWGWSRHTVKRYSSTSAGMGTREGPPSPSAVILARFFRTSASSSRATDSQETKFEQWKEKNIPPPLPPIDFDLS